MKSIYTKINITKAMNSFSFFAQMNDLDNACKAVMLISQKTLIKPSDVLKQIIDNFKEGSANYCMAVKILNDLESLNSQDMSDKRKAEIIEDSVNDAILGLKEILKSGNSAVIRNYIEAVKIDLNQIERVL